MTVLMDDVEPGVVAEAFARGEPRQSDTPFAQPWPLAAWPDVPTKVIAGRHDRLFSLEFTRALALERLGVTAGVIDGGHLPALSRPAGLADMLDAYAQDIAQLKVLKRDAPRSRVGGSRPRRSTSISFLSGRCAAVASGGHRRARRDRCRRPPA
jgi:hypothetical protein